ncbi:MAG: hypothetical protein BroJett026_20320 [Betaproteobacteria bacterium]|nr:MAG: hypothetical protein BroJett026_20320 [Betaproteobacteria bacterium]
MGPGSGTSVVLYVVDEDASVRDALCRLATSAGFEAHPYACLDALVVGETDPCRRCVLLDAAQLATRAPAATRKQEDEVPVIVLCAGNDEAARRLARKAGARLLLRKPVDAQALFDAIAWVTEAPD